MIWTLFIAGAFIAFICGTDTSMADHGWQAILSRVLGAAIGVGAMVLAICLRAHLVLAAVR